VIQRIRSELFASGRIIHIMRRYLMAFLIVLTALRGLAGDAMAVTMLSSGHAPMAAMMGSPHHEAEMPQATSSHPCHEAAASDDTPSHGASSCTTCQLCHLSVFTPTQASLAPVQLPHATPALSSLAWASAERVSLVKPPIL
jgi:hypothetical protein